MSHNGHESLAVEAPPQRKPATGRWTKDEHALFIVGMRAHPRQWKRISQIVQTRTLVQVRTHAQKCWNDSMMHDNPTEKGTAATSSTSSSTSCPAPGTASPPTSDGSSSAPSRSHSVASNEFDMTHATPNPPAGNNGSRPSSAPGNPATSAPAPATPRMQRMHVASDGHASPMAIKTQISAAAKLTAQLVVRAPKALDSTEIKSAAANAKANANAKPKPSAKSKAKTSGNGPAKGEANASAVAVAVDAAEGDSSPSPPRRRRSGRTRPRDAGDGGAGADAVLGAEPVSPKGRKRARKNGDDGGGGDNTGNRGSAENDTSAFTASAGVKAGGGQGGGLAAVHGPVPGARALPTPQQRATSRVQSRAQARERARARTQAASASQGAEAAAHAAKVKAQMNAQAMARAKARQQMQHQVQRHMAAESSLAMSGAAGNLAQWAQTMSWMPIPSGFGKPIGMTEDEAEGHSMVMEMEVNTLALPPFERPTPMIRAYSFDSGVERFAQMPVDAHIRLETQRLRAASFEAAADMISIPGFL